jgi:hypothetical protein
MRKEYIESVAHRAATEALKNGKASVKDAKSFARRILDICDGSPNDNVPSEKVMKLREDYPHLMKHFVKDWEDEHKRADDQILMELRRRIKN